MVFLTTKHKTLAAYDMLQLMLAPLVDMYHGLFHTECRPQLGMEFSFLVTLVATGVWSVTWAGPALSQSSDNIILIHTGKAISVAK